MTAAPALAVRGLAGRVGSGPALAVAALDVAAGERLVVFGPNGAGKTTLLRLVAATLPRSGLGAERWEHLPVAYLPQRPYLFRGTARANLALGLDAAGVARAEGLAGEFGVAGALDRAARALSGGERQRLALARVLARPEPLVLLDEPLAPLDARDRMVLAARVVTAIGQRAALIVTHDHDEAAVLGERVAVMISGTVRQVGPVGEVFALPADDEVAGVVGVGNVLAGEVEQGGDGLVAVGVGPMTVWGAGEYAAGAPVAVLFGAEAVTLYAGSAPDAGSARNVWPGRVEEVRPAGRLVEVLVDTGARVAALVTPGSLEALGLEPGAQVTLAVKATAIRVVPR